MKIDFEKGDGLVPAIIQDWSTNKVLMLGFMNEEAFAKTQESGQVTFFSRTKKRLWTKGEESGNFLDVVSLLIDCDDMNKIQKIYREGLSFQYVNEISELMEFVLLKEKVDQPMEISA